MIMPVKGMDHAYRRAALGRIARGLASLLMLGVLVGCGADVGQTFLVRYTPFLVKLDPQGEATVTAIVAFAKSHPLMPLEIDGYHYGQYSNEGDSLREERVRFLVFTLTRNGIGRDRIGILGTGLAYPQGSPMPELPPDTVRVSVGL
jgi:hypothetical protein